MNRSRRGFTVTELLAVIVVVGILAVMIGPRVTALMSRAGASNASTVIALDLEQAVSLAARQRRPVRITADPTTQSYTFADRASGTVLFKRLLGTGSASSSATGLTFSPNPIDVFPTGLTSAGLTVSVTAGSVVRQVTMSTGGFVRVIR